jgi:hypothetical protein
MRLRTPQHEKRNNEKDLKVDNEGGGGEKTKKLDADVLDLAKADERTDDGSRNMPLSSTRVARGMKAREHVSADDGCEDCVKQIMCHTYHVT